MRPVQLLTESTRLLSRKLWEGFPAEYIRQGRVDGVFKFDDFHGLDGYAAAISGATAGKVTSDAGGYTYYVDTTTSAGGIIQVGDEEVGVCQLTGSAEDNGEVWLTHGDNVGALGKIGTAAGTKGKLIFEAGFKVQTITVNEFGFYVGLGEPGLAAENTIADAGTIADKDFIGFFRPEGNTTALAFIYRKEGQAMQTVIAAAATLAADTYVKAGFMYDPDAPTSKKIKVVVNNTELTTYVTGANLAAATFPLNQLLNFLAGGKNASGAEKALEIDWWAFGQLALS